MLAIPRSVPRRDSPQGAIIYPSLLAADFANLGSEMRKCGDARADGLHIDVMDGTFVQDITFGPNMVRAAAANAPGLYRDVHLMIVEPRRHVEAFYNAGAEALTIHKEACPSDLARALQDIRATGMRSGVSVKPGTAIEDIFDVLPLCDLVLIMSVEPGAGGQKFIPETAAKIAKLKAQIEKGGLDIPIAIDGGINAETAKICIQAGAEILIAGSFLFRSTDMGREILSMKNN